jgi:hypothetical protein
MLSLCFVRRLLGSGILILGFIGSLSATKGLAQDFPRENPQAVAEVLQGKRAEANAAWWGFDPQESTQALQAAIRSGAKRVVVPRMPGPWIVDKIELESDQEIFFEPGVEVVAKKGAFRGRGDCLFTAWNKRNLRLIGPGATLRMHRDDYAQPPYEKAEWRHVLSLRGCNNVLVEGLTLAESGGDGIYIAPGRGGEPCTNIVVRNVVCDRNYRQGISVISARDLLIENTILRGTAGTPPAAGIDFEPNLPREVLTNCVVRNCRFEDNAGMGILISLGALDARSEPVSIRIENCITRGRNARSFYLFTRNHPEQAVGGVVELLGCRFEDTGRAGILLRSKPAAGLRVVLSDCVIADPAEKPELSTPISFAAAATDWQPLGGVHLNRLVLEEKTDRPPLGYSDPIGLCLQEVQGQIIVRRAGGEVAYNVDEMTLEKWVPCPPVARIPAIAAEIPWLTEVLRDWPKCPGQLPPHRLRYQARYAVWAGSGETVELTLLYQRVGNYRAERVAATIADEAGRQIRKVLLTPGEPVREAFAAEKSGIYWISAASGQNTFRLVDCSHPVAIVPDKDRIHLMHPTGIFLLPVPAGATAGLVVGGDGQAERVTVRIRDLQGQLLWQAKDIAEPAWVILEPVPQRRLLALELARPIQGILEDVTIQIRGVPPVLGFSCPPGSAEK